MHAFNRQFCGDVRRTYPVFMGQTGHFGGGGYVFIGIDAPLCGAGFPYIFIHETDFGDITYEIERTYKDWIEAHYGPFNGMDRIFLPMMPRLTRSVKLSPRDGTVVSAIDLETRPTGLMAFCISYERDRP